MPMVALDGLVPRPSQKAQNAEQTLSLTAVVKGNQWGQSSLLTAYFNWPFKVFLFFLFVPFDLFCLMMRVCSKDFRRKEKYCVNHFSYGNFKLWSFKASMTLKIICYSYYFFENAIQLTLILFSPHCSSLRLSDLHLLPTVSPYAYGWGWAVISSNTPLWTLRTVEGVKILCSQTNARTPGS